ncbi:cell division and transport-associated protein TolA [Bisgaardia hudsonensis]|uniref:Cell division and transport-associated protein TolA n=2 Tax=Bisgaardia hudsonensis TaxID=109472 RepID=A0A4R2N2E1_9PAST|nr:cell division and transport-associated protein TolA [Bisgaardia hudsonensis]
MGGGEGNGDVIGAVMVDTGNAAQEWGRIQQAKKVNNTNTQKIEPLETRKEIIEETENKLEQTKVEQDAKLQAEKEAKFKAEQEAKLKAEKEAKLKAEQEAKLKAEKEAKLKAEQEAKLKAEKEAKLKAEQEAKLKAEKEAKLKAEQEAKLKAEKEAKLKVEQEAKLKAEKEAKLKVEQEAKLKAEKEAKLKAEQEAKLKAKKEAKLKAEKEVQLKAEKEAKVKSAQRNALDDFINGGDIGGGSASIGGNQSKQGASGTGAALGVGDGGKEGDRYGALIKKQIQRRFLKEPGFINKVCIVEVELARNGAITDFRRLSGPDDICTAALSAVSRTKRVPSAPNEDIYRKYQKFSLEFKLR